MPSKNEGDNQTGTTNKQSRQSDMQRVAAEQRPADCEAPESTSEDNDQQQPSKLRQTDRSFSWLSILKFLSSFAVIVYAVVAIFQWQAMERQARSTEAQLKAMQEQADRMTKSIEQTQTLIGQQQEALGYARRNAESAEKSVSATQRGVDISEQSMRFGEAAYMVVQGANVSEFQIGQPVQTIVTFLNAGNTPAYKVDIWANIDFRDAPVPAPMPPLKKSKGEESKGIVAPKGIINQSSSIENFVMTEDALKTINQQRFRLYIWGRARYEDIFNRYRWTTFCMVHKLGTRNFDVCPNNNEAN